MRYMQNPKKMAPSPPIFLRKLCLTLAAMVMISWTSAAFAQEQGCPEKVILSCNGGAVLANAVRDSGMNCEYASYAGETVIEGHIYRYILEYGMYLGGGAYAQYVWVLRVVHLPDDEEAYFTGPSGREPYGEYTCYRFREGLAPCSKLCSSPVVSAAPAETKITLTVNIDPAGGGSVTKNPDKEAYEKGETVILTATPNEGYQFDHWSAEGVSSNQNPLSFNLDQSYTITAHFKAIAGDVNSTADRDDSDLTDGVCNTGVKIFRESVEEPECTLRAAIQEANKKSGKDRIAFAIPTSDPGYSGGVFTIRPQKPLPAITETVAIDATTQSSGKIELNGASAGANAHGLDVTASDVTVKGLIIKGFKGNGVVFENEGVINLSDMEVIENCKWGILANGSIEIGASSSASINKISNNGKGAGCSGGGIWSYAGQVEAKVIKVTDNGGPGILAWDKIGLESGAQVNNNKGPGIQSFVGSVNFYYPNADLPNQVIGNKGYGIWAGAVYSRDSDPPDPPAIHIGGNIEVRDNGKWGMYAKGTVLVNDDGQGLAVTTNRSVISNNGNGAECWVIEDRDGTLTQVDCKGRKTGVGGIWSNSGYIDAKDIRVTGNGGPGIKAFDAVTIYKGQVCNNTGGDIIANGTKDLQDVIQQCDPVISTHPVDTATGVAVNTAITASFSGTMDASTINPTTFKVSGGVTGTVTYDAKNNIATFIPSSNLSYSTTYTATITTGVKGSSGDVMTSDYAWDFTTISASKDSDNDGVNDNEDDSPEDNRSATPQAVTGKGVVTVDISSNEGAYLTNVTAISDEDTRLNKTNKPSDQFRYGMVYFKVNGVATGGKVPVILALPSAIPYGSKIYKADSGGFYEFPDAAINGNTVTMTLTDGGSGDSDGSANGAIESVLGVIVAGDSDSGGGCGGGGSREGCLKITIISDETSYSPGDTLTLSVSINNLSPTSQVVDAYLGVIFPDGSLYFFDSSLANLKPAKSDDPRTFTPVRTSLALNPGYQLPFTNFFSVALSQDFPVGEYTAFAAFAEAGSVQAGTPKLIGDISLASFTVTR